jgi:hypothetical protein
VLVPGLSLFFHLKSGFCVLMKGLSSCVNLKWLSVAENKLVSLKGVEGMSKLQVSHLSDHALSCSIVQYLIPARYLTNRT